MPEWSARCADDGAGRSGRFGCGRSERRLDVPEDRPGNQLAPSSLWWKSWYSGRGTSSSTSLKSTIRSGRASDAASTVSRELIVPGLDGVALDRRT